MARYKQIGNERIQLTAEEETILNAVYPVEKARLSQNQKKNLAMENELIEIIKQSNGIQSEVHRKKSILDN